MSSEMPHTPAQNASGLIEADVPLSLMRRSHPITENAPVYQAGARCANSEAPPADISNARNWVVID